MMVFALGNMKRKLLFVPVGGLGNRMRSIASAVSLTRKAGVELEIIWFCDWALNACFCKLFKPFVLPDNVVLRDAAWKDYIWQAAHEEPGHPAPVSETSFRFMPL